MTSVKYYLSAALTWLLLLPVTAQVSPPQPVFPVPSGIPNMLFYLQRTPNANTIVCELNQVNGQLNDEDPVHVFWIRYTENGVKQELNFIQRKFAYGIKTKKLGEGYYELHFVSYKKQKFFLKADGEGRYRVYANINGKQALLSRVYLHINGGSFWSPNVEYVELSGRDPVSGLETKERKKISQP
ncbi:MAG TPA: DUF4833 domain-containing protein [Ferruginibacter sp.]|nr:DUF4833 domain-containing protein [Ferruginibacter sp.]HMP21787.1 DUF4833 domain-containing protein [Ferruginibacter sp.]